MLYQLTPGHGHLCLFIVTLTKWNHQCMNNLLQNLHVHVKHCWYMCTWVIPELLIDHWYLKSKVHPSAYSWGCSKKLNNIARCYIENGKYFQATQEDQSHGIKHFAGLYSCIEKKRTSDMYINSTILVTSDVSKVISWEHNVIRRDNK